MRSKRVIALLLTAAACMGLTLGGCGNKVNESAAFATLDDTTIPMGVANFYVKYQQAMYDSFYMSYFGEDMWEKDIYGNGNTMTEDVKNDSAEQLEEMYLLQAHMDDYGVTVTDEENAAIAKAVDDFLAANSKEAIAQVGAENREYAETVLRLQTIQSKMHEKIIAEADTEVTDEEAAQRTFSYVKIDTAGHTDEDSNYVEYTEEEKAGLSDVAASIAASEDFDAAVEAAGYTVSTESYGSAEDEDASLDAAVLEAADELKEGQVSAPVETDDAYYVLRLDSEHDEEATASKREELISEKQEAHYEDVVDGWKEAAKWTIDEDEWAKVVFEDHFKQPEAEDTETSDESLTDTESVTDTEMAPDTENVSDTETK